MQDDYATALQYYGRVDHGGQAIEAVMHQSAMLSKLGHLDAARQQLQSLRDNFPQFAPRFTLAEAELLLNAQNYDDALDVLDVALKDQPDDADVLILLILQCPADLRQRCQSALSVQFNLRGRIGCRQAQQPPAQARDREAPAGALQKPGLRITRVLDAILGADLDLVRRAASRDRARTTRPGGERPDLGGT